MCYSKEVQATTGAVIGLASAGYYYFYSIKYHASQKKWLLPFLKQVILAFVAVGGHQIFEFFSIVTQSQVVYKVGLIISLSSIYFLIRSLEILLNRNLRSTLAIIVIAAIAIYLFFIEMSFEPYSFYVRHNSAFLWASAWMFLFIYFHICAVRGRRLLKNDSSQRALLSYLLATIDISFILSVIYVLVGYAQFSTNVCTDSPSIWCTFFVVQVFALPIFLSAAPKIVEAPEKATSQTVRETAFIAGIALVILALLIAALPFFNCLALKFVFP